jgi:hypothetical protein
VQKLSDEIDARAKRNELNLYVTGYEDAPENEPEEASEKQTAGAEGAQGQPEAAGAGEREPPSETSAPEADAGEQA